MTDDQFLRRLRSAANPPRFCWWMMRAVRWFVDRPSAQVLASDKKFQEEFARVVSQLTADDIGRLASLNAPRVSEIANHSGVSWRKAKWFLQAFPEMRKVWEDFEA